MALCVRRLRGTPGLGGRWRKSGERSAGGGAAGRGRDMARLRDVGWHPVLSHCSRLSAPIRRPFPAPAATTSRSLPPRPGGTKLIPLTNGRERALRQLQDSIAHPRGQPRPSQQLVPLPSCVTQDNVYLAGGESWHLSSAQLDCFRSLFIPGICRTPYQALAWPAPDTQQGVLAFHPSSHAKATSSPGGNQPDMEQQLAIMHAKLREELPNFFRKNPDYSIYRKDMEFVNNVLHMRTRGLVIYQLLMTIPRFIFLSYFSDARLSILKLTCHPETGSIQARWSVSGLPLHSLLLQFYRTDKSELYRTYDAHSTFYLAADGLICLHKMDRVMPSEPLTLPKKTLLAAALVVLGLGENRPALNLLSTPKTPDKLRSPILP
ncbi:uncharacterized protein C6orf136 homolog isoform 2-T2 [Discoglossus pictus]